MFVAPKHYRTRGGKIARVYATDGQPDQEIHGAIKQSDGWEATDWNITGRYYHDRETSSDLIDPAASIPEVSETEVTA